jgi:hypothetical protein
MADARPAYAARPGRVQGNAAGRLDLAVQHAWHAAGPSCSGQRSDRARKLLRAQLLAERPLAT